MKRCSSAPCLAAVDADSKKAKANEDAQEPNAREYLQLALARVLELQREIKDGTYVTRSERTSDLEESSSEEDLTREVLFKVFEDLPGSPQSVASIIDAAIKPKNLELEAIRGKRIQLLGYDTCRRTAIEFMKNAAKEIRTGSALSSRRCIGQQNYSGFRLGTYSRNEPRVAHRRTGLLRADPWKREPSSSAYDIEIRDRMLRSLDLHLAVKQTDYTAKLMRSGIRS